MLLEEKLKNLPGGPGVYLYKDAKGTILYVGKAKSLRTRVRSYFRERAILDPAKQEMVGKIAGIETITVGTETDALVLEANLIQKHQPPYNVVLRDDKFYLFIKITTPEDVPRVFLTRRLKNDGARYFGPYSSAQSVRKTLRLLQRIFPHRGEREGKNDTVFPHPLFTSPPPPLLRKERGAYQLQATSYKLSIQNIIRFLRGEREDIIRTLREGMEDASRNKQFEKAAMFRDQLQAIEHLEGTQNVYLPRKESFDAVSIAREVGHSAANVFQIRSGKLIGKQTFLLRHRSTASLHDTLRQFLLQYYGVARDIPKKIFIPIMLSDSNQIARWIRAEDPPTFSAPSRGRKKRLLDLGLSNAMQLLKEQESALASVEKQGAAHRQLMEKLMLHPDTIHRVEIYDISNIQGALATASMVVFIDGVPQPKQYKKFRMRLSGTPNDFAMIAETLRRRFAQRNSGWPMPDLIIIDGGKGQLSTAQKVLDEVGVQVPLISIAKREEIIFTPHELRLPFDSGALYLIQRMRDEAHRFTISYHRLLRSKEQRKSILDEIPGIGPAMKKKLLTRFGSLAGIRSATASELEGVIGKKAGVVKDYL